jgi:thiol-disulfide isomerase/thioredoxin
MISLSDVVKNNKLVFVDFWASWCGPCRASIPHLKEVYEKYHSRGFEILAVSYDSKREAWEKAIADEELTWLQGSNLKGWNCPTVSTYAVRGIPTTILISNEGKILGRSLHGKELTDVIEAYLE